jgi:enoyl-[acyl-carrier protein] reductase II
MSTNRICSLFTIKYPIIQAGMVWCSGWKLAAAVSNAGGLGLIGAGSMRPDVLREHIQQAKAATDKPFGVNVPLLFKYAEEHMNIIVEEGVKVVFTSAGNPATWTGWLKERGITVVHVVPNTKLAVKCVERGVDAIVCEGFEAGGHNGKDEITSMVLIPQVVDAIGDKVPVIAAGGIGDGRAIAAALALGADGVQIGSRFAITQESSAHQAFKQRVVEAGDSDTVLTLKEVVPVRLIKNAFYQKVEQAYAQKAEREQLVDLLGSGRARKGIFEGDLEEGELEIGQVSGLINTLPTVADLMQTLLQDYQKAHSKQNGFDL